MSRYIVFGHFQYAVYADSEEDAVRAPMPEDADITYETTEAWLDE